MNDSEIMLAAIDGAWPKEALPTQDVWCGESGNWWMTHDKLRMPVNEYAAVALFRDSGLAWLVDEGYAPMLMRVAAGRRVQIGAFGDLHDHDGSTLLSAIHAAIQAQHTGGANAK